MAFVPSEMCLKPGKEGHLGLAEEHRSLWGFQRWSHAEMETEGNRQLGTSGVRVNLTGLKWLHQEEPELTFVRSHSYAVGRLFWTSRSCQTHVCPMYTMCPPSYRGQSPVKGSQTFRLPAGNPPPSVDLLWTLPVPKVGETVNEHLPYKMFFIL